VSANAGGCHTVINKVSHTATYHEKALAGLLELLVELEDVGGDMFGEIYALGFHNTKILKISFRW
jgi:hypothetical protein